MEGHIKIHRRMLEWEWYSDNNVCRLFFHMLLKANWKDGRFKGREIKRGSFVSSRANLAKETGLTEQNVRTAIKKLISTGEVTSQGHSDYTVFTVNNYDKYQLTNQPTNQRLTNDQPAANQRLTNDQPAANQRLTTIEEKKEKKEGKKARREEKNINGVYVPDEKLNQAILDFIRHRKAIKKPMTDRAVELLIKRLDNLTPDHDSQIELLEHAILKGWQTPYPIKDKEVDTKNSYNDLLKGWAENE